MTALSSLPMIWVGGSIAVTIVLAVAWHWMVVVFLGKNNRTQKEHGQEQPPTDDRQLRERWLDSLETKQQQQESTTSTATSNGDNKRQETKQSPEKKTKQAKEMKPPRSRRRPTVAPKQYVRPPMPATEPNHNPSNLSAFYQWYNVEISLYRMYAVGRTDCEVTCPFIPRSERGHVQVELEIVNDLSSQAIDVYWVTYKGVEQHRGFIRPRGGVWHQTTWMGHPWVFRDRETQQLLLHYIPYKTCPTTPEVHTVSPNDANVGLYRFAFCQTQPYASSNSNVVSKHAVVRIVDDVFPIEFPSVDHALKWTLQHVLRYSIACHRPANLDLVLTYLYNILQDPSDIKYRQIRIANKTFYAEIWNTPSRGVFLLAGFEERNGHAELGGAEALSRVWMQHVSNIVLELQKHKTRLEKDLTLLEQQQPEGAVDGYGRAGYGRAG